MWQFKLGRNASWKHEQRNAAMGSQPNTLCPPLKNLHPDALINPLMEKFWARRAAASAWRSKSSLPGEHGRPCCSHVSRRACAADCSHAPRQACTADFSRSSCLIKQLHACHGVWLNFDTVNIIQWFAILTCQLFVSKRTSLATNVCASSQTRRFFYHGIYVPYHETMPSFMFFGWLFYLLGFKNQDSHCFRTRSSL